MKRPRSLRQQLWAKSARFREIGLAALREVARERAKLPKCGATARSTGGPCQQPAMENGRCRYHGGRTPSGDDWHQPRWPHRNAPNWNAKFSQKISDLERASRRREKLIAAMPPEKRAAYERWKAAHKPGPAAARARSGAALREAQQHRKIVEEPIRREPDPELIALERDIELLRAMIEEARREQDVSSNDDTGVLG